MLLSVRSMLLGCIARASLVPAPVLAAVIQHTLSGLGVAPSVGHVVLVAEAPCLR